MPAGDEASLEIHQGIGPGPDGGLSDRGERAVEAKQPTEHNPPGYGGFQAEPGQVAGDAGKAIAGRQRDYVK